MSNLDILWDSFNRSAKKLRKAEDNFFRRLGPPSLFIPTTEPLSEKDKSGDGYWRVKNGVIHYRIHPSGRPDIHSREEYTKEFIQQLAKLLKKKPINK